MQINSLFGKLAQGMCKMTVNGNIAVKTSNGYKCYNVKKETLTNVTNFCFDMGNLGGMEMFFAIPTQKVNVGDIILIDNKPKCVTKVCEKKKIVVIDYESNEEKTIIPERHLFFGNVVFYSKITSLLGNSFGKGKGMNNLMKMMMANQLMCNGNNSSEGEGNSSMGNIGSMMALSMMMGGNNMFDGMFEDFDLDEETSEDVNDEDTDDATI